VTETAHGGHERLPSLARLLAAQVRYQARLVAGGRTITIGIGLPVILLIASHGNRTRTTEAAIAGYAVFGLTLTAWNTHGVRLVAAREAGILKRWQATPLPRTCYFLARILATVLVAVIAGTATVAAGVLLYHIHLTATAALGTLITFVIGALAWAATATALTAAIPTIEGAGPTLMLAYFPIIVISGVFGDISEPGWLSTIAAYLPAQPLAHAVTASLGQAWPAARDLAVLAVWAIAGIAIAAATFRWEPHRPARQRAARGARRGRLASRPQPGGAPASELPGGSATHNPT
jgi:ABC-2 type transport system permease protein